MGVCLLLTACTKQKLKRLGSLGSKLLLAWGGGFLSSLEETPRSIPRAFPYLRSLLLVLLIPLLEEAVLPRPKHCNCSVCLLSRPCFLQSFQKSGRKSKAPSPNKRGDDSSGDLGQVSCCPQNCSPLGASQFVTNLCIKRQNILIIIICYRLVHASTAPCVWSRGWFSPHVRVLGNG